MPFSIPNINTPDETINKILSKISTGKYFEIIKVISEEKSYLNILDTANRSVLHYILLNDELSNSEKYHLIETVIKYGAPFDIPNIDGIRPLHLACSQQNRKLVRLLLSKKAEVNSKDKKFLSPLHYATNPDTIQCNTDKKKLIISDKKTTVDFPIDELYDSVYEYVKNDDTVLRYINHIASIFKNQFVYDEQKDTEYIDKIKSIIHEIIKNKNPLDKLKIELVELKKTIIQNTTIHMDYSYSAIDIIENSNGDGPTYDNKKYSIFPFKTVKNEFELLNNNLSKMKMSSNDQLNTNINKIKNIVDIANNLSNDLHIVFNALYELKQYISTNYSRNAILVDFHNLLHRLLLAPNANFLTKDEMPEIWFNNTTNFTNTKIEDKYLFRGRKNQISIIGNYDNIVQEKLDSIIALSNKINEINSQIGKIAFINDIQIELLNIAYINLHYNEHYRILGTILSKIQTYLKDNDGYDLLEQLINKYNTNNPNNQIDSEYFDNPSKLDNFIMKCGTIEKSTFNDSNIVFMMHSAIRNTTIALNSYITICNMESGYKYIDIFHNSFADDNTTNIHTNDFTNNSFTKIKDINIIPETFLDFYELYNNKLFNGGYSSNNAIDIVVDLLNNYSIMISDNNNLYFVTDILFPNQQYGLRPQVNGIFSFIYNDNQYANTVVAQKLNIGIPKLFIADNNNKLFFDKNQDIDKEFTIIGSSYGINIYIIRILILSYIVQQFSTIYENGQNNYNQLTNIEKMLFDSMKDIRVLQTNNLRNNTMGELFALMAKIVDEIFIYSLNNIVNLGASNHLQYLLTKQNYHFDNSLLSSNNLNNKKQLLIFPKEKSVINNSLTSMIASNDNLEIFNIFNLENTNETEIDFENTIINTDKFDGQNICYKFDEDLIGDLLDAGADINAVGRSGETALSFALTIQNEKIIESLIRSGARIITNNTNNYQKYFEQFLNSLNSSPIMNIEETDNKLKMYLENKTGFNMTFQNSKIIIPMTMYLFLHQISIYTNTYPNMWNYDNQQTLLSTLSLSSSDGLPIASIDDSIINNNGIDTINESLSKLEIKLTNERDILIRLDNSINNLNTELRNEQQNYRQNEISRLIRDLQTNRNRIINNIQDMINQINLLLSKKQNIQPNNMNMQNTRKLFTNRSRYVSDIYKQFFNKIINKRRQDVNNRDYLTYIKMWEVLLNKHENDNTQLVKMMYMNIIKNDVIDPKLFESYNIFADYYTKVLEKYGRDLIELSPYLSKNGESYFDQNYVLKQIFTIIEHVFSYIISINFINTIAQLLAKKTKSANIDTIYQTMKTSGFIEYCIYIMPKQIIKIVCNISESEEDKINSTVNDILNKALERLSLGTYNVIDDTTISQLKDTIIPFFVDYIESYTLEMYKMMISQCKMFIHQAKMIRVLKLLSPKTILELNK